ncbi:MAG: branched-chain amino acid ABC transporter permease, partial [Bacilli bacterium]
AATGVPVTQVKVLTFALSAALAGIAGALYAQYMRSISPATFHLDYSIEILVIVVLGGLGSFTGSILAATILVILPEFLRVFNDYRMIIYSVALIIIMLKKPGGILGRFEFSLSKLLIFIKTQFFRRKVKDHE